MVVAGIPCALTIRHLHRAIATHVAIDIRPSGELSSESYNIQIIVAVLGPPNNPLQACDVTSWLRRRVEVDGKRRLFISSDENLAMNIKDPSPGNPKVWKLVVGPLCGVWQRVHARPPGHTARYAAQVLFIRYMIFNRRAFLKVNVVESDNHPGSFFLERTIDFSASRTIPKLVMLGASFGHPAADTRTYDITEVRGRS